MTPERIVEFRFYEELNDFLPKQKRKISFSYTFKYNQTVKDAIEAVGIPHTEVDLIVVNGSSEGFSYTLQNGDRVAVYPVFESIDIKNVTRLAGRPLRDTKFILDVHLGKLCKYLRMLGFDTYYRNNLDDDEIVERAGIEKRIILTRDIGILKNGLVTHGYWIRSKDWKEQLDEVLRRFDLHNSIKPFYRCIACNGFISNIEKTAIAHLLNQNTKECFHTFYRCGSCKKIYWEGSHYENMKTFVDNLINNKSS